MLDLSTFFLTIGLLLSLGLVTHLIGHRSFIPRVTLLMVLGLMLGPSALDLLPDTAQNWFPAIANTALVMIGFLLGEQLTLKTMRERGAEIFGISVGAVVVTIVVIFVGLKLIGVQTEVALLLAGIAPATDPAATLDVIREVKADGRFTRTLKGVVAIDDLWGLIAFSVILASVHLVTGQDDLSGVFQHVVRELGGAVLVGLAIGLPAAVLTGRMQPGEPSLIEALAMVFVCLGISLRFEVSFLIASMVMGATVANLARHHEYPFNAIVGIEWPFLILFFVLAGASFELEALVALGTIGTGYVLLRIAGRLIGGWLGGISCKAERSTRNWMGAALLPQAGVAIGMALVAAQHFPEVGQTVLTIIVASTVLFEILGPIVTRFALVHVGDAHSEE